MKRFHLCRSKVALIYILYEQNTKNLTDHYIKKIITSTSSPVTLNISWMRGTAAGSPQR